MITLFFAITRRQTFVTGRQDKKKNDRCMILKTGIIVEYVTPSNAPNPRNIYGKSIFFISLASVLFIS